MPPLSFRTISEALKKHAKLLCGGLLATAVLIVGAFAFMPSPSAHGALKGHAVELSRNAIIRIIFSQPMNHRSVEQVFRINPSLDGTFSWEGTDLIFTPKTTFEKGKTYEVVVGTQAKSFFLKPLKEEYRQSFTILDFPEVSLVTPVDKTVVMQDQILTVLFDHPLRTLTGNLAVPTFLSIKPEVKGTYHWLGTNGFEFVPDNGWAAATEFTVTVPKGTKLADGGSIVEDKTWSFSTPSLTVALASLFQHHKPTEAVRLEFNYPVAPEALAKDLVIQNGDNRLSNQDFSFETEKDQPRILTIKRKNDFELGKTYTFKLSKGITLGLGPKGLEQDWEQAVTTDELGLRLVSSFPAEGSTKRVDEGISFCFSNPIAAEAFKLEVEASKQNIQVTPPIEDLQISPFAYLPNGCSNGDATMYISGRWKPSTAYTVTMSTNVADIYGQKLAQPIVFHVTTNPFEPRFDVSTYGIYGVLASHLPRLYQARTLNWNQQVNVKLESGTLEGVAHGDYGGTLKARKSYDASAALNTSKIINIDLDELAGQKLPNGFYKLSFENGPSYLQPRNLMITDTALTVKRDTGGKVLVWATDMKSGQVVPRLSVRIWSPVNDYDRSLLKKVAEGKTDAQGVVSLTVDESTKLQNLVIEGSDGARLGYVETEWSEGIGPWNYGLDRTYEREVKHHIGYVYTERRIYRPDQKIFFKGVVRFDEDARLRLPTAKEVQVVIHDGEGNQVWTEKLPLNAYGTFNGSFQLDPSMKLGTYRLSAGVVSDKEEPRPIETAFDVREYRRPDFRVDVTEPTAPVLNGQEIRIPVQAAYYQGIPLKGGKVSYTITRSQLFFQPMQGRWWNDWYSFTTDDNAECYWYCRQEGGSESIQNGEAVLDDKGNFVITLPASLTDYKTSATYAVDVTVTDVNQRTVSSHLEFPVHKGEYYLGIRPDYSAGWQAATTDFEVVSVNIDGSAKPKANTTVKLYKRVWTTTKKTGTDGNSLFEWQKNDTLLDTKPLTTDGEGKGRLSFTVTNDGEYVAVIEARDSRGQLISASASRYVYRGNGDSVRVSDDHQMKIIQNKASYDVGDTASLIVQTPYENTKALVTIERGTIREYRVIDLGNKQRTVDLKITDAETPNVYVSVLAVKGGGETGIPEFRMGYANLQVNTTKKILTMTVTPDREVHRPGESVTVTIETKNSDGAPVQAEVSLAVVDERVIALLGNIDKDILGKFWFPRLIGVETGQSLTMLVKKVFFSPTEGGGGGKGDNSGPAVRGNFQDTAYWNANIVTGADGKARVTFNLPDNLTSWNLLAIGETKDTQVGHAEAKLVTRRDLMVEPLLPRILRRQDTAIVGATVINATDRALDAQVTIKAEGVTVESATRNIHLDPQGRGVVKWKVQVPANGTQAKFTVSAKATGYEDAFEMTIPVLDYSVPEVVSASGILEKNVTETFEIPEGILPNVGQVDVSVQPNIGNGLQKGLDYLVYYPYGCSEQKTSGLLANLMYEELVKLKVTETSSTQMERAKQNVRDTIKVLVSTQRANGGWSFWSDYDKTYPWLTGYVMWGLTQAQKAGFDVDSAVLERADEYLRDALQMSNASGYDGISDAERAQVLFMLSERNTNDLSGYAATLYERREGLPEFAKLFLALAYKNVEKDRTSTRAAQLLNEVRNKVIYLNPSTAYVKEKEGYYDLLSSDLRTTSLYLQALLRLDPKHEDVERVLRYLVQARKDGYWYTTNDTALTLLGLVEYARANPVDKTTALVSLYLDNQLNQTFKFEQGDVSAAQSKAFPLPDLAKAGNRHQIGLEKDTDKRYFYDINMRVYRSIQDIEPFSNGMTIVADTYALNDTKRERPLQEIQQGENVLVRLKLLVPKRRQYVAMEYHLPAGLEGIDFALKTSPQSIAGKETYCYPDWQGEQRCLGDNDRDWWWENVWHHIEYRDDRVFLFADNLEPGVYEYSFIAQATTPGEYRIPPARAYEFYNPTANAHNEGKVFRVKEK